MPYEGFVFPGETSALSDTEYARALACLDWAARCVRDRDTVAAADPQAAAIILPDAGWHPCSQPSFELDGSIKNAQTSYALLAAGDRDIVRKMRLYGHSFTGYQLATLEFAAKRPWVSRKLPENWDDVLAFLAGPPDQSVFDYVSAAYALPRELRLAPPRKFGETGWLVDGAIVNNDTYSYQQIVCLLFENGVIDHLRDAQRRRGGPLRIVEIGGGFGGLAYHLFKLFDGGLRYAIIDLPESLAFSSIYCATLFPEADNRFIEGGNAFALDDTPGFTFIPNTIYRGLQTGDRPVDLVVNTLSLSEMSDAQIHDYCAGVQRMIGDRGIFFEQNHQADHQGPGQFFPQYFKNLRACTSSILPADFEKRRGQANLWINASYRG